MRKFFKVISILNIFAVVFMMVGVTVIYAAINDPEVLETLNWSRLIPYIYVAGFIILLGSAGNVTFALRESLWKKADNLDEEIFQYHEMTRKLRVKKIQLADAITSEKKKDQQYQEGYDAGYQRKSNEIAHETITE